MDQPNESEGWRLCQYLGFHPAPRMGTQPGVVATRQDYMRLQLENNRLPACVTATQLNRRLSGLEPWPEDNNTLFQAMTPPTVLSSYTLDQLGLWDDSTDSSTAHSGSCGWGDEAWSFDISGLTWGVEEEDKAARRWWHGRQAQLLGAVAAIITGYLLHRWGGSHGL